MASPVVPVIEFVRRYTVPFTTLVTQLPYMRQTGPFNDNGNVGVPPFKNYYMHFWVGPVTGSPADPQVSVLQLVADRPIWGLQGIGTYTYYGTYRYIDEGLTTWLLGTLNPNKVFLMYEANNKS